ncbi:hypothetical protein, partial [Streptomyces sp. NPDC005485]|uniref:hypothetical protein n=1 Tax=Streptomyces sp. NPDC005485 TaxID=3155591 RepID=UPI0033B6DBDB
HRLRGHHVLRHERGERPAVAQLHLLTVSPACIVSDTHDVTPALENMYRAMGQEVPQIKRILELNPSHALISGLKKAYTERKDEPPGPHQRGIRRRPWGGRGAGAAAPLRRRRRPCRRRRW